jgi:aspartyl-tRNA synthetase
MIITQAETLSDQDGQQVCIQGFVQTIRKQSKTCFIILRDRTGLIQCVVDESLQSLYELSLTITTESTVKITGLVHQESRAKSGYEVVVQDIVILSSADAQKPIPLFSPKAEKVDPNVRMDFRWLDLRKPEKRLIFEVWTLLEQSLRTFWIKKGFLEIHSPKLMDAASEGGAEFFKVEYFDRQAFLAQSPQFYKQMAMAAGFDRVFEVGPIFRAEPSFTPRHATEFTGFDMEISWIESYEDVMKIWEEAIVFALSEIKRKLGSRIKELYQREIIVPTLPFPRLSMKETKELLKKHEIVDRRDGDLSPEEEREISTIVKETYGHEFVFVTEYPKQVRPFYHMRLESDPTLTKSFDLLWDGIEITTGAQREHHYEQLKKQALEKGIKIESIQTYLDFFRYGCPPHGGMGAGAARMIMKILDLPNIREATYLHRSVHRLTP